MSKSQPLIAAAIATCTPYGYFGFVLTGHALDALHGAHRHIHTLTPPPPGDSPTFITSDRPTAALSRMLFASGAPLLAFFDTPVAAACHGFLHDGAGFVESLRNATHAFACLAAGAAAPRVRVFDAVWRDAGLADLARAVLEALGAPASPALVAETVARVLAGEGIAAPVTVRELLARHPMPAVRRFDAAERGLLRGFADAYGPLLEGRVPERLEWPRALFAADPGGSAERDIAMIGRARHLIWGPYLHLPPGPWRADVQFEVADARGGETVEADVSELTTRAQLAHGALRLPSHGYFRFTLDFQNRDPDAPLEIRLGLRQSAIEGRLTLRRVVLVSRAADAGSAAAEAGDPQFA